MAVDHQVLKPAGMVVFGWGVEIRGCIDGGRAGADMVGGVRDVLAVGEHHDVLDVNAFGEKDGSGGFRYDCAFDCQLV